jgi:Arc/MetJ family transcription regulator
MTRSSYDRLLILVNLLRHDRDKCVLDFMRVVPKGFLVFCTRTTLVLDDGLVSKTQEFTGLKKKSAVVREALRALFECKNAQGLAWLDGTKPDLKSIPRRQSTLK